MILYRVILITWMVFVTLCWLRFMPRWIASVERWHVGCMSTSFTLFAWVKYCDYLGVPTELLTVIAMWLGTIGLVRYWFVMVRR